MRAFVGLPLDAPPGLQQLLQRLRDVEADLKVVEPTNLHVTLKFLGEIPEAQAHLIVQRLKEAGFPLQYTVRIRHIGAFPDWKKFNIVWAGLEDPQGHIGASFARSEKLFAELGVPMEARGFTPHVTIARKRTDRGKEQAKQLLNEYRTTEFGECVVPGPRLYKSTLTPQGPIYESMGGPA